jgi:hypothetical protein
MWAVALTLHIIQAFSLSGQIGGMYLGAMSCGICWASRGQVWGGGETVKRTSNEIKDLTTSELQIMMLAHGFPF